MKNLYKRIRAAYYAFKNPAGFLQEPGRINFGILKPCMRFIDNTIEEQTRHINEEVMETIEEIVKGNYSLALAETVDILQSCITALEIYRRNGYDVQTAIDKVFMKNNNPKRNYYCEQAGVKNPDLYICCKCENVVCNYNWQSIAGRAYE